MDTYTTIDAEDGRFHAYIARPTVMPAPAIVVLQEIFGINADMRETCDDLAAAGFIALCPDLFWRQEPGMELSHWTEAEWEKGLALYKSYDFDLGVSDVIGSVTAARSVVGATGKVGVMGFCLGGLMTFLTAARGPIDAAASYYGGGTEKHLSEATGISAPLLIHLGEEDEFISKHAQQEIGRALADNPRVEIHTYPGCRHAFARHTGTHFDPGAAALANGRTRSFFDSYLR